MSAIEALSSLSDFSPKRLNETHDLMRLLGIVLAQVALLEVVTDLNAEDKDRVAAARALLKTSETPEQIAERLRTERWADLTVDQLRRAVELLTSGRAKGLDVAALLEEVKEEVKQEV